MVQEASEGFTSSASGEPHGQGRCPSKKEIHMDHPHGDCHLHPKDAEHGESTWQDCVDPRGAGSRLWDLQVGGDTPPAPAGWMHDGTGRSAASGLRPPCARSPALTPTPPTALPTCEPGWHAVYQTLPASGPPAPGPLHMLSLT